MTKRSMLHAQPTVKGKPHDSVEVKDSPVHGVGLFAKEDIKKDTILHITHIHLGHELFVKILQPGTGWLNVFPNNLVNHSKENENCHIVIKDKTKELVTLTEIIQGEELFVDYTKDQEGGFEQPQEDWKE